MFECEQLFLCKKLKINENIAFALMCGIVSDTNRFLFNMNSKTLENVGSLIKKHKVDCVVPKEHEGFDIKI